MTSIINIMTFICSISRCIDISQIKKLDWLNYLLLRHSTKSCTKRYVGKESLIKILTLPCNVCKIWGGLVDNVPYTLEAVAEQRDTLSFVRTLTTLGGVLSTVRRCDQMILSLIKADETFRN